MIGPTSRGPGATADGTRSHRRRSASVSDLLRTLIGDISLIARREVELAAIELKAKSAEVGGAAALLAAGAVIGFLALAALVAAAVLALAIVLPAWAAAVVVGVLLLAGSAVLALTGRARLRAAGPLAPTQTIDMVQEDIAWMRSETAHLHPSE